MEKEYKLTYELKIRNNGAKSEGYKIKIPIEWKKLFSIINQTECYFQKFHIYSNDFVILENITPDYITLKFNKPFKEENDTLFFE